MQDKTWLWTIEDYTANYSLFDNKQRLREYERPKKNLDKEDRIWICRFCGRHQKINIKGVVLMDKPFLIKSPKSEKKITNPDPIIIFLIDWSGSMQ
jgi:hypothetical protein